MLNDNEKYYNKGVPTKINSYIPLKGNDLIHLSDTPEQTEQLLNIEYNNIVLSYLEKLIGLVPNLEFFQTLTIVFDEKELKNNIIFSPTAILNSIWVWLNINITELSSIDFNNMLDTIDKKVQELKNIKNENELINKFPYIAKFYQQEKTNYQTFMQLVKNYGISLRKGQEKTAIFKIAKILKIPNSEAALIYNANINSTADLEKFTTKFCSHITKLLENYNELENYLKNHPLDIKKIGNIEKNKIELYIADKYINQIEILEKDEITTETQKLLYYLTVYFIENKQLLESDYSFALGDFENKKILPGTVIQGRKISINDLYKKYKRILLSNPKLKIVDFAWEDFQNMNLKEIDEFITEYINEKDANWEFLPSKDDLIDTEIFAIYKKEKDKRNKGNKKYQKSPDELLDLYIQKKHFFAETDPFKIVKGTKSFYGYVGYIYKNGKVILEKYLEGDEKNKKIADNNAIYVMNIEEFAILSRLSKTELIANKLCNRYIHRGQWQEKILAEISQEKLSDVSDCYTQYVDNNLIDDETNRNYGLHN